MDKFYVVKHYGHFSQTWNVCASNKDEAWEMAETDGRLLYQSVYQDSFPPGYNGYVKCISNDEPTITNDQYYEWLREAEQLGMVITQDEYFKCYGLPFESET